MPTFKPRPVEEPLDIWNVRFPVEVVWGIYARQSTPAQLVKHAESTEMQTEELKNWLLKRQVAEGNIHLYDADLGMSGQLRIDQRPDMQRLVTDIEAGRIKAILVYQISRLFRDLTAVQYNVFADICKQHHCVLVTSDGMIFNFHNPVHMKMYRFLAEMAAEYIPQQIGLLHGARLRKARKGFYVGLGTVSSGYIVDYRKGSPTFQKFIPYPFHAEIVYHFYRRYYALEGNFSQLYREMQAMPFVFPSFDPSVDSRNLARWKRREVPGGGYSLSRYGLLGLLTNPVYIGWWIVQGDIVSRNNHERIIREEDEYLFWYAFDRLSEYTIEGAVNEYREEVRGYPKRFYQYHTTDHNALLKERIYSPLGLAYVHVFQGKSHYAVIPRPIEKRQSINEVDTSIIDIPFTRRFFERLEETHDFDEYQRFLTEETQQQSSLVETVTRQLEEIERQQEAILDEKLAIRTHINEKIRAEQEADSTVDTDTLKKQLEAEAEQDFERLRKRAAKLDTLVKELTAKLPKPEAQERLQTARKFADFQTEVKKLIPVWNKKPLSIRTEFVNLFVKQAVLTFVSPHWIQLDIDWFHPAWGCDTLYIHRKRGKAPSWTDSEHETLKVLYPLASRDEILAALPTKSWNSIRAEAINIGVQRMVDVYHQPPTIPQCLTWSDWQFMQEHGIDLADRSTKCEGSSSPARQSWAILIPIQTSHPKRITADHKPHNCTYPLHDCSTKPL